MKIFALVASLLASIAVFANDQPYKTFGDVRVYYSAFNSSFIAPDVASAYNITRGKDRGLVNIAVVPQGSGHGTAALVGGTVNNLLAQQQTLEFMEIREGDAIYYLAPFRFANEDPLNFTIHVRPANAETTSTFTFSRTFHWD
ncbi:MAG: DUF4426 domain-containing protein [Porticoccaceae bacterium]